MHNACCIPHVRNPSSNLYIPNKFEVIKCNFKKEKKKRTFAAITNQKSHTADNLLTDFPVAQYQPLYQPLYRSTLDVRF